jgi:hypothetical protein
MARRYEVDLSVVASDIIDGEAIILHHITGDYFSTEGTGAVVWRWIGEMRDHDQILRALKAGFPGAKPQIGPALDAFLADLLRHELIRETGSLNGSAPEPLSTASFPAGDFLAPVLHVYSDMRGVLLVDPIHEVEASAGWPVPKRADSKS